MKIAGGKPVIGRFRGCELLIGGLLVASVAGCGNDQPPEVAAEFPPAMKQAEAPAATNDAELMGDIKIDGSSTVFPISKAMASSFRKAHPDVDIEVGVSGTGGGFEKFCSDETDITGASRPINMAELEQCQRNRVEYIELPIAFDSVAVVVHEENEFVACLTVDELEKMWAPAAENEIVSWNQIRAVFPTAPLRLFGPGQDSGTFDFFTLAIVGREGASRGDYTMSESDAVLVNGVASNPGGLGYFGYSYYLANRDELKLVAVDNGYGCTRPSAQTVADTRYAPLSRPIFIYIKKSAARRPEVQAFTRFFIAPENAQAILEVGNVPLPTITLRAAASRFAQRMTGSVFEGSGAVVGVSEATLQESRHY